MLKINQGRLLLSITVTYSRYINDILFYATPNGKSNKASSYNSTTVDQ